MNEDDFGDLETGATTVQRSARPAIPTRLVVVVVDGPNKGTTVPLDRDQPAPLLIGQSPSCDVKLEDPLVSRRHASIELSAARIVLTDLDSTNGTFVDGVRVTGALLRGDESIKLGQTHLRLERRTIPTGTSDASPGNMEARAEPVNFGRVVGASAEVARLFPLFRKLAASTVPVIIEGETGTGKEVLAESIHEMSARSRGPFVVFDCTAVPASLMESELFGHEKGAFTGATSGRAGFFEQAHGGTLLIDEIGDLDPQLQPKLLRAIERKEIRRVGGQRPIPIDVRLLAATRRDLDRAIQEGRFRDDLYHRLAVARVELPPLRKRQGDVRVLVAHFEKELGGSAASVPPERVAAWERAEWPGNVRQLRNAVARWLALGELGEGMTDEAPQSTTLPASGLPASMASGDLIEDVLRQGLPLPVARLRVVEAFEARYIAAVLEAHGGNVAKAAEASGIARRYFQLLRSNKRRTGG